MTKSEIAGAILVAVSTVLYVSILVVPWFLESTEERVTYSAGLAISGEAAFWLGALVAGPSFVRRCRAWLSPANWFRGREASESAIESDDSTTSI